MELIRKYVHLRYGIMLIAIAIGGVAVDPVRRTNTYQDQTDAFNQICMLVGWIGVVIVLISLFRFAKHTPND